MIPQTDLPSVSDWYGGKVVFLTGGTGFVGICLVEKLLRTVPNLQQLYLLIRPKKGKDINERLDDFKNNAIFEVIKRQTNADALLNKLKAVAGDVSEPDLGLSLTDRQSLTECVDIVFHSAATLDFAVSLKTAVETNVLGTTRCLKLASECRHLKAFVQVSSAYANAFLLDPKEQLIDLTMETAELSELMGLAETLSEEELEEKLPQLLNGHPNSYTLTKQMAEHCVASHQQQFPCTIVRPSMITSAWKEPIPGWTISRNGPQGFVMGATRGVLRRLPVAKHLVYDYIPVDVVVNGLLTAGMHAAVTAPQTTTVFHCTSSTTNPFRWRNVEHRINEIFHQYPLKSAVWYPRLVLLPSVWRFMLSALFVHILPAVFFDFVTLVTGGRPILLKLHRNVTTSLTRLAPFIFNEWTFDNSNVHQLQQMLRESDRGKFVLEVSNLNWSDYFEDLAKGVRVYLSKENLTNLPKAIAKDKLLYKLWFALKVSIYFVVLYLVACLFGLSFWQGLLIAPVVYYILSFI